MIKYPLIEAMNLKVSYRYDTDSDSYFVYADDLEKALQDAPVLYGANPNYGIWDKYFGDNDSHTARLVCLQPIKKKTKAEAAIELLEELNQNRGLSLANWENEIKRILEMPE